MMNRLDGYKTIITAGLVFATGIAQEYGAVFPEEFVPSTAETLIGLGAIFGALRAVTKGPMGKQ